MKTAAGDFLKIPESGKTPSLFLSSPCSWHPLPSMLNGISFVLPLISPIAACYCPQLPGGQGEFQSCSCPAPPGLCREPGSPRGSCVGGFLFSETASRLVGNTLGKLSREKECTCLLPLPFSLAPHPAQLD